MHPSQHMYLDTQYSNVLIRNSVRLDLQYRINKEVRNIYFRIYVNLGSGRFAILKFV